MNTTNNRTIISISEIKKLIDTKFQEKYSMFVKFISHENVREFCIDILTLEIMSYIKLGNDLGIPPIQSLIYIHERKTNSEKSFNFSDEERQAIGAIMGYVFKSVLGYKSQQEACTVKGLDFKTATKFLGGKVIEFTN